METAVKKEIGLDILLIIFTAALFWMLVSTSVIVNAPIVLVLIILAIPVWISFLAITLALVSNYSAMLLTVLVPFILALFGITQMEIIAAAILIMGLIGSARFMFVHELKSRVEFKTRLIFYSGTKLLIMAVIIMLTGISMPHITKSLMSDDELIPEPTVKLLLKPYEPFIAKSIPGGSLDVSINRTIELQLQEQYPGNPQEVARQMEIINNQLAKQLSDQFNQKISPQEDISSVVTSVINKEIRSLTVTYPVLTPIAIFGVIILASRIIIPFFSIFILIFIASLIWASRKINLIKLLSVSKPVEYLEL